MKKENLAVLLIDMQKKFVRNLREKEAERIIPNQIHIIQLCKKENIPFFVLELDKDDYGETISELKEEISQLEQGMVTFIQKTSNSGFKNTDLEILLKNREIKKIFFMGINADYCVHATASDALKKGFEIVTSNDVISGQDHHSRNNSIDWYKNNGACLDSVVKLSNLSISYV